MNPSAPRVMFFYDGFNLYHSLERARLAAPAEPVKWIDLTGLAHEHLSSIGPTETLAGVRYFTAYAEHLALTKPEAKNPRQPVGGSAHATLHGLSSPG
jgi:hypothetical protein